MVDYRILGTLEVASNGRFADLGPPKQRALLAILILHANEIVPVDRLIDLLWGDRPPRAAAHAIQVYISELRRALEPLAGADAIATRAPGYILAMEPESLDSSRVERLVDQGAQRFEAGDLPEAAAVLGQARGLWRGAPLSDFAYEEFAQADIRHLTDIWLHGTEVLAAAELGLGRDAEALRLAEATIREDPLRERPRELQLLSLYRAGRHAEALRTYEDFRLLLAEELGVVPSPALRQLQERILLHDPLLRPEGTPASGETGTATRNPYKGLRAFGESDAADFFGREALVGRLLESLASGTQLIALVGPSGSGKSSVIDAGLIPALRGGALPGSERWTIERLRPDARSLDGLLDAAMRYAPPEGELVLVIDQFEELFIVADDAECTRSLRILTRAAEADGGSVRVVLALRADFYDRPLRHPGFASAFVRGIVNVMPLTASELEAAVVEPAQRGRFSIDPALLAELVSDTVERPGALPLLQHALAELFDRRTDGALGLDAYRAMGGLGGALSRRAEEAFAALDAERQEVTRQVFLRSVRVDEARPAARRRVPLRELTALGFDPVALSDVLRTFQAGRLITLDRDPTSGDATVEAAHEALFAGWERLAAWIDVGRADLRRRESLADRVAEWIGAGRQSEDLLSGRRLDEFASWSQGTSLRLTADERAFLEAGTARRGAEQAEQAAAAERQRRLERRARTRLVALVGAVALFVAAVAYGLLAWPGSPPDVALVYPGPGDGGMYDSIVTGFDDAVRRFDLDAQTVVERPEGLEARLRRLSEQGVDLVVVGYAWSNPEVEVVARDHPGVRFLASDYWGELPNVSTPRFASEEGAFLIGAAAVLMSEAGRIGVIADYDNPPAWRFVAGHGAGAEAVDPEVEVLVDYIDEPTDVDRFITFIDIDRAAREMYRAGADVVFYSGDIAPLGLFEAAYSESAEQGRHLWVIGADTDWYVVLPLIGPREGHDAADWRPHALTSMITRYDVAFAAMLEDYAGGLLEAGEREFDLADGAFEIATSGGFLEDDRAVVESLRAQILAGEIEVPKYPDDRGPPR